MNTETNLRVRWASSLAVAQPWLIAVASMAAWRLVRLHGGSMDARSESGQWAEFSLEIPQPLPEIPAAPARADL